MPRNLEGILDHIGPCGRFQILLLLVVQASEFVLSWGMLIMTVAGATPDWWCLADDGSVIEVTNSSWAFYDIRNDSIGNQSKVQYCDTDGGACPNITYSRDMTSIVSEWNLVCDKKWVAGIITTIQMVGVSVGAISSGHLGDVIGRKKTFFLMYALILVSNLITAFSTSVEMYTAMRFFVGVGVGGALVVRLVLPLEYLGKSYRAYTNLPPFWSFGTMIMAGLAYCIRDWRMLAITVSAIGTPYLLTWWFVPESARWLMVNGRFKEAEEILSRIAKFNRRPPPDMSQLDSLEKIAEDDLQKREKEGRHTVIDLFRSCKYAKKSCLLFLMQFTCGLLFYGLSFGVKNLSGNQYVNLAANAAVELPAYICLYMNNKFGRRYTAIIFLALAAVTSTTLAVLEWTGNNRSDVIMGLSLLAKLSSSGVFNAVSVFVMEQYPTVVRNIGLGFCETGARIGAMVAPLLIEFHAVSPAVPYIGFSIPSILSLVAAALLSETKGQNMPDYLPPRRKTLKDDDLEFKHELSALS